VRIPDPVLLRIVSLLPVVSLGALGALAGCTSSAGGAVVDGSTGATKDARNLDEISDTTPPVVDAELQSWLAASSYTGYLPESVAHPSAGPHGGTVRAFVNRALAASLDAGAASHPVGAAAVKELHTTTGLRGWAVMVKTRPDPGPASWYWYEVFSTAPGASADYSGQANPTCTGCHGRGIDAVRTTWPLR
jgi:hypothetical protein